MSINKYGLINVLKKNYEMSKDDENFMVGFEILLKHLLWYIDEKLDDNGELKKGLGRHVRQKFWSEKAIDAFNSKKTNRTKNLQFEHVVPLNIIKSHVIEMLHDNATVDEIVEFLDRYLLVCIITKEEDDKLTELGFKVSLGTELSKDTVWNRYKESGIKVCNVECLKNSRACFIKPKSHLSF